MLRIASFRFDAYGFYDAAQFLQFRAAQRGKRFGRAARRRR